MTIIRKGITIASPMDSIFAIVADPYNLLKFGPGVTRVSDVKQSEQHLGDSFRVNYSVKGLKFAMNFETRTFVAPTELTLRMEGNMNGTFGWGFRPQAGATAVDLTIDYEMRLGLLGKALNGLVIERLNESNSEEMLTNLKALAESR